MPTPPEKVVSTGESVGGCAATVALIPFSIALWGNTLAHAWTWFVRPLFPSLPPLSVGRAAGLLVVVAVLRSTRDDDSKEGWSLVGDFLAHGIALPLLLLLEGWIIQRWFV